jgi:uncharacterized protein YjaG (DUF416 family)
MRPEKADYEGDDDALNELIDASPGVIRIEDHAVGLTVLLTVMSPHDTSDASYLPAQSASVECDWAVVAQLRDCCERAMKLLHKYEKEREERAARKTGVVL